MSEEVKKEPSALQKKINSRNQELKELKRITTIDKSIVLFKNKIDKLKQEKKALLDKHGL